MSTKIVRFNLGAGKNFMKVKIHDKIQDKSEYLSPETLYLKLTDCRLVNRANIARRIHAGSHKSVCSWVSCSKVEQVKEFKGYAPIYYNPKVTPYWRDSEGNNIDGMMFKYLFMVGRQLYVQN